VKKILEFLGNFLLKILFIGAITFFIWHACMPEYKFYFVFFVIITFLTVMPIKINLPKIAIKNERISKMIPKIKKIIIMVLAGILGYLLLFFNYGKFHIRMENLVNSTRDRTYLLVYYRNNALSKKLQRKEKR